MSPEVQQSSGTVLAHRTQLFWTVIVASVEVIVIVVCAYGAFLGYSAVVYGVVFFRMDYALASVAMGALYVALCIADNQYDLLGPEWNEQSRLRGLATILLSFVILLAIGFTTNSLEGYSRGTFLAQLIAALLGQMTIRAVLWKVIDHIRLGGGWRRESMVVVAMPGVHGVGNIRGRLAIRHEHIVRWIDFPPVLDRGAGSTSLEEQISIIRSECRALPIDVVLVLFGADNMEVISNTVDALSELPVRIQLLPIELTELMHHSRVGSYGHLHVLELFCGPCSLRDRFLKRAFDIAVAVSMLFILWPLFIAVAALIKLDSRGPVFFRQTRLGFNNEPIRVLKFRSMAICDDARDEFHQAVRNDPRVTALGRILRRTNIDELPQLLNVLRGDMSIVGPRPHAIAHNRMFADQIRKMFRRHNVKPGITGWAQVNGLRGETDTFDKMKRRIEHDLYYVDNWSFFFDVKILIMTVLSKRAHMNAY